MLRIPHCLDIRLIGHYELKRHKPWFDEGCSELLCQWKQAELQWLQDPSEINGDNLNNIRHEAIRYFRTKKREYLKDKISELATRNFLSDVAATQTVSSF
jgi:hypothetical protein